jgi:hypothetical protein
MKKIIDDQGRLFGKISVIDIIVVIVVAALAAGFIYKRVSGDVQQIVNANDTFYVTFKCDQLRSFSLDAAAEGDIFFRQYDTKAMGRAVLIETDVGRGIMLKTDGTAVLAEMEGRFTMYITVECTGSVTGSGFYINGYMNVAEGSEFMIQSNRLLVNTSVYRISETLG